MFVTVPSLCTSDITTLITLFGFNLSSTEPLDVRTVAIDEADRLSRKPFNCYKGLMIFQLENQIKLKNDLIEEIEPKWYENKYLWFWYGALIMWLIK